MSYIDKSSIARKLANYFAEEDQSESEIKKLIIRSKLKFVDAEQRNKYFTYCEILVDILNHYISTQDKIVRMFKDNSYAILQDDDLGWKEIVIKVKGDEDSKFRIDGIPIFKNSSVIFAFDAVTVFYNSNNYKIRKNVDKERLYEALDQFFYNLMVDKKISFGDINNLDFRLARKVLIEQMEINTYQQAYDNRFKDSTWYNIYESYGFNVFGFVEDLRNEYLPNIDKDLIYQEFIKTHKTTTFREIGLCVNDFSIFNPLMVAINIDFENESDTYKDIAYGTINADAKIAKVLNRTDSILIYFLDTSKIIKEYYKVLDIIPKTTDIELKYSFLISILKCRAFLGNIYGVLTAPRSIDMIKQYAEDRFYNVINTESLPIPIYRYTINTITHADESIPNKELIKKLCGVEVSLNIFTAV